MAIKALPETQCLGHFSQALGDAAWESTGAHLYDTLDFICFLYWFERDVHHRLQVLEHSSLLMALFGEVMEP